MSSVLDNIKKNDNNFSFISTFFSLVGNKEFKDAEISTLYTRSETSETSIWRSLSAVAEQLGSTFYSNTLNFIDNITNIDLCKTLQLQSMISLLGVKYTVFNDVLFMPLEILNLIDIFSVKREHLTSTVKMNVNFVNELLSGFSAYAYDDIYNDVNNDNDNDIDNSDDSRKTTSLYLSKLINEDKYLSCAMSSIADINNYRTKYSLVDPTLSTFWTDKLSCLTTIDDAKLNTYMSAVYKGVLLNKLCASYNNKMHHLIYELLSDNIILSDFALPNDIEEQINTYKLLYSIPYTFNVLNEVDNYENGEVELSDYTNYLISVMQMEIDRRKSPYINEEPKTRYKFYREREVREYAKFIENEYSVILQKSSADDKPGGYYALNNLYALDPNYIELYNLPQEQLSILSECKTFIKDNNGKIIINLPVVDKIAQKLVEITNGIREAREMLKMQCQKYFMRGTKLLLNSVIQEYLRSNIVNTLDEVSCLDKTKYVFDNENNYIDIVEYVDPTNYYNISTDTDALLSTSIGEDISSLNMPYWKLNSPINAIGAVDGTNLFVKLPTIESLNFIFNDASMSAFYNGILENKFSIQDAQLSTLFDLLKDFLTYVFALGAESTFLSNDTFHTYDSYSAKLDYDNTVKTNEDKFSKINAQYGSVLSILTTPYSSELSSISSAIDQSESLDCLLDAMSKFLADNWQPDMLRDVSALSAALVQCNEIHENIALSALSAWLSSKYELQNYTKQEAYDNACKTDSYILQQEYNLMLNNYTAGYNLLSILFDAIVSSGYIPDDFKQEDLTLDTLLSNLCAYLSILPADQQPVAVKAVEDLSTTLSSLNKLSAVVELEIMLETLSSLFDEELGYKKTEIDVLRSSDVFKSREKMFKQYSGVDNADTPYYYMSNVRHPSYMLHPCLSNYVENEEYDYDIDNIANLRNADETKKYIYEHLSDLIDEDGYFINIWQNPLNSNTDYLSKYEQVSHRTVDGTESEVIGYDGLFYPKALYDFLHDVSFTYDLSAYNLVYIKNEDTKETILTVLQGNFIESLSGVRCLNTLTNLYLYVVWNPWYTHLDLSENEAKFIAEQLIRYRKLINALAINANSEYDIYKYGLDAFNNSYILVKAGINDKDEDEKLNASGYLLIKLKNHPIAFPAYDFTKNDIDIENPPYSACLLIQPGSNFNKDILAVKLSRLRLDDTDYYLPLFLNFTFSNNGNVLVMNGVLNADGISASYPLIVNVDLYYNYDSKVDRTLYFHNIVDIKNPEYGVISLTVIESLLSDWIFNTYFYDEDKIGVIYSKISSKKIDTTNNVYCNSISAAGAYYNILDSNVKQRMMNTLLVDEVSSLNEPLQNVCIDTNGTTMVVAYLDILPDKLVNFLSSDIALDSNYMSALYGKDDVDMYLSSVVVKTKEYEIGPRSFICTNEKSYAKYTDAGFFGLLNISSDSSEHVVNNIGNTSIAKIEMPARGVYKYLVLAELTDISNMIDFRQTILARPYEGLHIGDEDAGVIQITTPQGTQFYPLTYMSAHYFEARNSETTADLKDYGIISSDSNVYDPFEFRNILYGRYPSLKIDESYKETIKTIDNILSDGYPYIVSSVVDYFEKPWNNSKVKNGNCLLQISEIENFPLLSILWGRWKDGDSDNIQIDFNPMFNSSNSEMLSNNICNCLKLFLNLNRAGESGLLNIYSNPLNGDFRLQAICYIKNLSDDKPKFMISADILSHPAYPVLVIEDLGNNIDDENHESFGLSALIAENSAVSVAMSYEQQTI